MHIALYFGSFNPVHSGHLIIASYMLNYHHFDEIWFVVSPKNPLKDQSELIDEKTRLEMLEIAVKDSHKFKVLDIEFNLPRPSYTVNTLDVLTKLYSNYKFSLIVGYDNILSFKQWKDYDKILNNHKVYVYPRKVDDLNNKTLPKHESIIFTKAPIIEISSAFIRKAISNNQYLEYFTDKKVLNYIKDKSLYKNS